METIAKCAQLVVKPRGFDTVSGKIARCSSLARLGGISQGARGRRTDETDPVGLLCCVHGHLGIEIVRAGRVLAAKDKLTNNFRGSNSETRKYVWFLEGTEGNKDNREVKVAVSPFPLLPPVQNEPASNLKKPKYFLSRP